jgi:hypothetical protein
LWSINNQSYGPTSRRTKLTPAERRELDRLAYWKTTIFSLEEERADLIEGVAIPVLGQHLGPALDYAITAAIDMIRHPDPDLRRDADIALFYRRRILALVRVGQGDPVITRFDTDGLQAPESPKPARRGSRPCGITFMDGSVESTSYGVDTPLTGRDLGKVLEALIDSVCQGMQSSDPAERQGGDVALAFRGRILAVIRVSSNGPLVDRFDPITG